MKTSLLIIRDLLLTLNKVNDAEFAEAVDFVVDGIDEEIDFIDELAIAPASTGENF